MSGTRGLHRSLSLQAALIGFISLILAACASTSASRTTHESDLYQWLTGSAQTDLARLLKEHPRFQSQSIIIEAGGNDALSELLAQKLRNRLYAKSGITGLVSPTHARLEPVHAIDSIDCQFRTVADNRLSVAVEALNKNKVRASLRVSAISESKDLVQLAWEGHLNKKQRALFNRAAQHRPEGSRVAPWRTDDAEAAASTLVRELVCGLRPQISSRLRLHWPQATGQQPFPDVLNMVRHYLARLDQIEFVESERADYSLEVSTAPMQPSSWQLWLAARPLDDRFKQAQAITYIARSATNSATAQYNPVVIRDDDPADYLDVELVESNQETSGSGKATLHLVLRLRNRAETAIDYRFAISGGHYQHCRPRKHLYRHDAYGQLEGVLAPGQNVLRRMVIDGVKHRPAPWFGAPACAGFRDLEAFANYQEAGSRVTEYLRWAS